MEEQNLFSIMTLWLYRKFFEHTGGETLLSISFHQQAAAFSGVTELQNDYKFHNNLIKSDRHMTGGERNPCDLQFQYEKLQRIVRESRKMQIMWSGKKIKKW